MDRREAYLRRVGLAAFPAATEQGLRDLHAAQALSIPFENISVLLGEPVSLDPEALFGKLVAQKRGGYCFELNGLFTWAMRESGFEPVTHLARVRMHNPQPGPLTHQLSLVQVNGRSWLADVGFGGPGIRYPMPLELDRIDRQDGEEFRLRQDPDHGVALELKQENGIWLSTYFFQPTKVLPLDLEMGNHFTSTWSNSTFRKGFMFARPFPGGKHTLYGREYKLWTGPASNSERLADVGRFRAIVREEFGLELDPARQDRLSAVFERIE